MCIIFLECNKKCCDKKKIFNTGKAVKCCPADKVDNPSELREQFYVENDVGFGTWLLYNFVLSKNCLTRLESEKTEQRAWLT